jgi:hypothetical protein
MTKINACFSTQHKADCRQLLPLISFSEYPEKNRQHQGNDDTGSNRKVEAEPLTLDINITWKMTNAQLGQPGPSHSNQNENDANNDEPLCHSRYL